MKFLVLSLCIASLPLQVGSNTDQPDEFFQVMHSKANRLNISQFLNQTQKSEDPEGGKRHLQQCSGITCEGPLCLELDCCGASTPQGCDCEASILGFPCRSCFVCSSGESLFFDCSDEVCGECVGITCSDSCIEDPCPSPSPPSRPSSPTPSRPSAPSSPSSPAFPSPTASSDDDSPNAGLIAGVLVGVVAFLAVVVGVTVLITKKNKGSARNSGETTATPVNVAVEYTEFEADISPPVAAAQRVRSIQTSSTRDTMSTVTDGMAVDLTVNKPREDHADGSYTVEIVEEGNLAEGGRGRRTIRTLHDSTGQVVETTIEITQVSVEEAN